MFQNGRRRWQRIAAAAACAAGSVAVATTLAQSPADKWWPGYSGGSDNSRYFASRQIDKSNVSRLQVAWTYPFGDTGSAPIVVRGAVYGRGRNGSLVAVDATTGKELWVRENMNGMTSRGMNYWESADGRDQRLIFAMNSLLQELDAKTGKPIMSFGTNGVVDLRVGIDGRDPATLGNIQSNTPGEVFQNLIILGSATGEGYMSPPGDIRAYDVLSRQAGLDVPHRAASRRVRLRDVAEGRVEVRRRRQQLGRDDGRRSTRHRLHPARVADLRLLRSRSPRSQPVRHLGRGARGAHGQAPVALPDRASRSLGPRSKRRTAADDHSSQRPQQRRRRHLEQDDLALRPSIA